MPYLASKLDQQEIFQQDVYQTATISPSQNRTQRTELKAFKKSTDTSSHV